MNIFDILDVESRARNLQFLIIGGHAVNAYGYSRFTKDLDLLIPRTHHEAWLKSLGESGFTVSHDGGVFIQLSPPTECRWPLDLMLVSQESFAEMYALSKTIEIGGSSHRVPSLDHLFALKFHVLKQEVPNRGYKDFMDVLSLAECNAVDLRSDKIRELCEKYGSPKIYERLLAFQ